MIGNEQRIVLDTDFINLITKYRDGDAENLFCRIFHALDKIPVIHPYVAENELMHNKLAQKIISDGNLIRIPYTDFLPKSTPLEILYKNQFSDLYKIISGEKLPNNINIFKRHAGMSFGEIHSILMATEIGIPLLFSNDKGAKLAADRYKSDCLIVQNAREVAELLQNYTVISSKERKYLKNYQTHQQNM